VIYGTVLAVHFMRHNPDHLKGKGKIIVTGSMIGVHPCASFPEYCAAKAGVHHWVRTVAPVLAVKEGIAINAVMPAAFDTPAMPDFRVAFRPEE
jgi:NAD(P)-dependent dehydrogenase (short-subunit alcohol dehydrogenase family)